MRCPHTPALPLALALALALVAAGCGGRKPAASSLRFEELADTSGLTRGEPLLRAFEPYRMANGVLRVRGRFEAPDGTRLQVSLIDPAADHIVTRFQVLVQNGRFDSPPLIGPRGPLPVADYRFELLAIFDDAWQTPDVMRDTDQGRSLRGPGITRGRQGEAIYRLVQEMRI